LRTGAVVPPANPEMLEPVCHGAEPFRAAEAANAREWAQM
jgi:hypothetical protein